MEELARGDGLNRIPKTMDGLWDSARLRGPWGQFEERGKAVAERQTDGWRRRERWRGTREGAVEGNVASRRLQWQLGKSSIEEVKAGLKWTPTLQL